MAEESGSRTHQGPVSGPFSDLKSGRPTRDASLPMQYYQIFTGNRVENIASTKGTLDPISSHDIPPSTPADSAAITSAAPCPPSSSAWRKYERRWPGHRLSLPPRHELAPLRRATLLSEFRASRVAGTRIRSCQHAHGSHFQRNGRSVFEGSRFRSERWTQAGGYPGYR